MSGIVARAENHGQIVHFCASNAEKMEENPFHLPSDQDIFLNRVREKKPREKKPFSKQTSTSSSTKLPPCSDAEVFVERRKDRENITDFIRKKREMFLLQMSLDTKREEIHKLQQRAQNREQALFKAEVMLEEDASRFEQFLQDNDAKCNAAMEKHDDMAKKKQKVAQQIKRSNQEIAKVKLEIEKYNDALADCTKYQMFLDSLTPESWFEEQEKLKNFRQSDKVDSNENEVRPAADDASPDMYFTEPQQLCDIFAALEKKNLFLIQNVQEIEEQVDDLKQEFKLQKKERSGKTSIIEGNISEIQEKIIAQEKKQDRLRTQIEVLKQGTGGDREELLQHLAQKVEYVFRECGFDPDQNPDTLDQLQKIEEHNELLISMLTEIPDDKRKVAEKKAENDRRIQLRKEKLRQQEEHQKRRLELQALRAKRVEEHIRKNKKGRKPVMFRSAPPKVKKVSKNALEKEKEEQEALRKKFFT